MKKTLLLIIMIATTLFLMSCVEKSLSQKNDMRSDSLNKSIASILSINSISYVSNYEQKLNTDHGAITTKTLSKVKRIEEPFVIWSKVQNTESHTNAQTKESITESYQKSTQNGLVLFYRGSDTEWTKSTIDDANQVNQYIEHSKSFRKACHYLLNTNLDSFIMIENQNGLLKFSGNISQASVVEAYEKYYREFYFDGGLIKGDKELTNKDELRKEITSGKINELMSGIPSLAFSNKPIPIMIWINLEKNQITKIEINKTNVTQAILNKTFEGINNKVPKVEKAILTYEIKEVNTLDEIPMPQ